MHQLATLPNKAKVKLVIKLQKDNH